MPNPAQGNSFVKVYRTRQIDVNITRQVQINPPFKRYAAPGIDSTIKEQGVVSSAAGSAFVVNEGQPFKSSPGDWISFGAQQDHATEELIKGFNATEALKADDLKTRKRGVSPWGGKFVTAVPTITKRGGIADMNPGAGSYIAGGASAASRFVRIKTMQPDRGMKLPILPQETKR